MCGAHWGDSTEVVKQCNLHRQATVATCHIWMPHLIMTAALSAMIPSPCLARQIVLTGSAVSSLFCMLGCLAICVEGRVNMMWVRCTHQAIYMIFLYMAGECILRVWQHSSVLQPCKCPICRRSITLLIPSEVSDSQQQEPEVVGIMQDLAKYNRIFGGGPVSFLQAIPILSFQCTSVFLSVQQR